MSPSHVKTKCIQHSRSGAPSFLWVKQKAAQNPVVSAHLWWMSDSFWDVSCFWSFPWEAKWLESGVEEPDGLGWAGLNPGSDTHACAGQLPEVQIWIYLLRPLGLFPSSAQMVARPSRPQPLGFLWAGSRPKLPGVQEPTPSQAFVFNFSQSLERIIWDQPFPEPVLYTAGGTETRIFF